MKIIHNNFFIIINENNNNNIDIIHYLFTCKILAMTSVSGLLGADISIGSRQPLIDNRQTSVYIQCLE